MQLRQLNTESITTLVHTFYDDVRAHPELSPVFGAAIGENWDPHLARMVDFWSTVMLGSRNFQGNVFGKHMLVENVEPQHFRLWFDLFEKAVVSLFETDVAEEFMTVARRIGGSLQYGFFGQVHVPQ